MRRAIHDAEGVAGKAAEKDILFGREIGASDNSWWMTTTPAARASRGERMRRVRRPPRLAGVWLIHAAQDFDERRFAGAILAHDGVHFAGPDLEIDAGENAIADERFANPCASSGRNRSPARQSRRAPSDPYYFLQGSGVGSKSPQPRPIHWSAFATTVGLSGRTSSWPGNL